MVSIFVVYVVFLQIIFLDIVFNIVMFYFQVVVVIFFFFLLQVIGQKILDLFYVFMNIGDVCCCVEFYIELGNYYMVVYLDFSFCYGFIVWRMVQKIGDYVIFICFYLVIGEVYQKKNDFECLLVFYFQGLKLVEEKGQKLLEGMICNGIGVSYFFMNEFDKLESYFICVVKVKVEVNDYWYYLIILVNFVLL